MTTAQAISSIESITFDKFNFMKQKWLRNLALTWLIEGHLTAENALKMVQMTEASIDFCKICPDSIPLQRVVELSERTIYTWRETNRDGKNPNSYIRVLFQAPKDKKKSRALGVLMNMLKEPIFTNLRTQQQLGYIV